MIASRTTQLLQGASAPFRGLRVIVASPSLWALTVLPITLTVLFLGAALLLALLTAGPLREALLPGLDWAALRLFASAVLALLLSLLYGALAYMLASLCSIPLNDRMSERVEAAVGELPAAESWRASLPRSVRHSIAGFGLWLLVETLLLPLQLLPGVGTVLGAGLGGLVTAWFLAHQLLDGPMSRRSMSFGSKMRFLSDHLPPVLGLGGTGSLVMLVPGLNLLALPVLVAGGAVLWVELEQERRSALDSSP